VPQCLEHVEANTSKPRILEIESKHQRFVCVDFASVYQDVSRCIKMRILLAHLGSAGDLTAMPPEKTRKGIVFQPRLTAKQTLKKTR